MPLFIVDERPIQCIQLLYEIPWFSVTTFFNFERRRKRSRLLFVLHCFRDCLVAHCVYFHFVSPPSVIRVQLGAISSMSEFLFVFLVQRNEDALAIYCNLCRYGELHHSPLLTI